MLADLPCPIYITTDMSTLLADALRAAGKDPQIELCRWNEDVEQLPSIYDDEPDYRPTEQRPLVYHLFGIHDEPDSMVLTEDDYFDYLHRRFDQQGPDSDRGAPGAGRHGAAVPGLSARRLELPRAVSQHHEPGGRQPAQQVRAYRRPDAARRRSLPGTRARAPATLRHTSRVPTSASFGAASRISPRSCWCSGTPARTRAPRDGADCI